jgi:superfamily II DNA or RNA helicase
MSEPHSQDDPASIPPLARDLLSILSRRAECDLDFTLHRVAYEWSLATALAINSKEDFQSLPKLNVEPFEHQIEAAITYFRRLAPRGLIADDVGLGKTITAGLILAELMKRRKVKSFLVVCPKLIMFQWAEELKAKFNIEAIAATGQSFRHSLNQDALITTYDTARGNMKQIQERGFDLLILDEAHKVRKLCGVENPAQRSLRLAEAMKARAFRYVVQLTATPLQTSLWDAYSLVHLLRTPDAHPLGPEQDFAQRYLGTDAGTRRINPRILRPEMREEFRRRLSETMIRTRRHDTKLHFPGREVHMDVVDASPDERAYINQAVVQASQGVNPLEQISLLRGILSSPRAASLEIENKLKRGRFEGTDREEWEALVDRGRELKSSAKLERLIRLIEELRTKRPTDWRVVVFTGRLETLDFIRSGLQERGLTSNVGFIRGNGDRANQKTIQDFMADPPRTHVIVSTDAGAEGVNLQAGNVLVNYDLPWNPMTIEQRIGRIQRLGQKAKNVIVYNLVIRDTVDQRVVARLLERLRLFESAIGEMEAILTQATENNDGDEDAGDSFEAKILSLVLKSCEKKDIEAEIAAQQRSIEAARKRMEEAHQEIEDSLGRVDPNQSGPIMPRLVPTKPELSLQDFTLAALTTGGGSAILAADGRTHSISHPGRGESGIRVTFDPDHPAFEMGRIGAATVTLYAEGERPFEHLVHEWMGKAQCLTYDTRGIDDQGLVLLLRQLLADKGLSVEESELSIQERTSELLPEVTWKANVSVFHDQYEKLITTSHIRSSHGLKEWPTLPPSASTDTLHPSDFKPMLGQSSIWIEDEAKRKALADRDIRGFSEFYESRLIEELGRLDRFVQENRYVTSRNREVDQSRKDDLNRRFKPELKLAPLAMKALAYEVVTTLVSRHVGKRRISVPISFVPLTRLITTPWVTAEGTALVKPDLCFAGHLANTSDLLPCGEQDCGIPVCRRCAPEHLPACADCALHFCGEHVAPCALCEKVYCRRHQERSADGDIVCRSCTDVCEESGARLSKDQLSRCCVSGRLVRRNLLVPSAVSGKLALEKHLVRCAESNSPALTEELASCELSGKQVLPSLISPCPDTGKKILTSAMVSCAETNVPVHPQALSICQETGARVRAQCLATCEITGKRILSRLLKKSVVSNKTALVSLCKESAVSGKWALQEELLECEQSGQLAIPDEFAFCSVSGKRILPSLTAKCKATGRVALIEHMDKSAVSGKQVLRTELRTCEETGRLALESELGKCAESGKRVLPTLLGKCQATGATVLPQHLTLSELSGKTVRKSLLVSCEATSKKGLPEELASCAVTGKKVDPKVLAKCSVTGQMALPEVLVSSQVSHRRGIPANTLSCPACEKTILSDEVMPCLSCQAYQCTKCSDGHQCLLCQRLRSESAPLVNAADAPAELASVWPKASKWRYLQCGHLTLGIGIPSAFNLFAKRRLIVIRTNGASTPEVLTNTEFQK